MQQPAFSSSSAVRSTVVSEISTPPRGVPQSEGSGVPADWDGHGADSGTGSGAGSDTGSGDGSGGAGGTIWMVWMEGMEASEATPPTPARMCCHASV